MADDEEAVGLVLACKTTSCFIIRPILLFQLEYEINSFIESNYTVIITLYTYYIVATNSRNQNGFYGSPLNPASLTCGLITVEATLGKEQGKEQTNYISCV